MAMIGTGVNRRSGYALGVNPRRAAVVLLAWIVGAAGCASNRPAPPSAGELVASGSELVASEALGVWLGPEGPRAVNMVIDAGRDAGKSWVVVPRDIRRGDDGRMTGFVLDWTLGGESRPRSERTMLVEADGTLSMSRVVQRDRSVETVFEPPLLVMPARINPGATVRQDVSVTVLDLDKPGRVKERGSALIEASFLGRQEPIGAGAGDAAGLLYVTKLEIRLSAARSERTTERWFAFPESGLSGLLRERFVETIRVFGVIIESTRQSMTCPDCARPAGVPEAPHAPVDEHPSPEPEPPPTACPDDPGGRAPV